MTNTRLLSNPHCPACGAKNDGALAAEDGRVPQKGDVAICLYCAEFNIYDGEPIIIRRPTPEEAADCTSRPELMAMQATIMRMLGLGRPQ